MYKAFLIKYGEIGVKGKNRFIFEDALVRQIKFSLKDVEGEFDVRRADGRIYVNAIILIRHIRIRILHSRLMQEEQERIIQ